jgi:hypothetical protein
VAPEHETPNFRPGPAILDRKAINSSRLTHANEL